MPKDYHYARLVGLFYCNMRRKDTNSGEYVIQSWLLGHRVCLTVGNLAQGMHLEC